MATEACAHLVVDLGFGDAGKGHLVDWLVRRTGAGIVVRFNGGAQAGHTVVTDDGRAHTFSQIGAGSFVAAVRTFLAAPVVVHPTALAFEATVLRDKGVADALARLSADARCRVVTPYHQALNRMRELARGAERHGSCGVGVGETVEDALAHPEETITLATLRHAAETRRLLARVRERKHEQARALDAKRSAAWDAEFAVFDDCVAEAWVGRACRLAAEITLIEPDDLPPGADGRDVVFEGAHGVLLDHAHGFPPYTTWSDCTLRGANDLLDGWRWSGRRERIGVLRSYHVRHGPGPLPTETDALDVLEEPHNLAGPWQGRFRRGWLDGVLLTRAIAAVGSLDRLALTHLDALGRPLPWRVAVGDERSFREIGGASGRDRAQTLVMEIEALAHLRIGIASYGPKPADVSDRDG